MCPRMRAAVRYYSDEAFLTAIRLHRNGRSIGPTRVPYEALTARTYA